MTFAAGRGEERMRMRMRWPGLRIDWFLVGIFGAMGLATLIPGPGASGGALHPELLTKLGVALIFFLHGLGLSFAALRAGASRWRLHLVVQVATFAACPLLCLGLTRWAGSLLSPGLALGFLYLGVLPSTVSSSVAMTAAARGNVAVAIFNATLSSLLGVVLTPLLLREFAGFDAGPSAGEAFPLGRVMLDLLVWLVLPLVVGQGLRPWLGNWAARNKRWTARVDRGTILLLVYTSFCDSVAGGVWTAQGPSVVAATLAGTALILATMLGGLMLACRLAGVAPGDRAAVAFCGSKKTLASGVPMAHLIFGATPELGLILLPIMIYHPLQLVVCGALAARWGRAAAGETKPTQGPANSLAR